MSDLRGAEPAPRFSVIVPTLGREAGLRGALLALAAQSLPRQAFEIVVAFDGVAPSPALEAACRAATARVVRVEPRRGPGAARNAAAAEARGEILAFTEDDCVPDRDWLANAARRFDEEPGLDVLDGATEKPGGRPVRRKAGAEPLYLPTNLFVRRQRFAAVGGYCEDFFDPASGLYFREDSDLGFTLEAAGARVARDRTVRVVHPEEHERFLDPLRWARRFVMDPLLARRHPERFDERIEVLTVGPLRFRRPFVRACMLFVVGLGVAAAGMIARAAPITATGSVAAIAALLAIWSKWRFSPARLAVAPLVPFVLLAALAAGERRAAALAAGADNRAESKSRA